MTGILTPVVDLLVGIGVSRFLANILIIVFTTGVCYAFGLVAAPGSTRLAKLWAVFGCFVITVMVIAENLPRVYY